VWNLLVRMAEKDVLRKLREIREKADGLRKSGLLNRLEELVGEERKYQRAQRLIEKCIKYSKNLRSIQAKLRTASQLRAESGKKLVRLEQERDQLLNSLRELDEAVRDFAEAGKLEKPILNSDRVESCVSNLRKVEAELKQLRLKWNTTREYLGQVARALFCKVSWGEDLYDRLVSGQPERVQLFWQTAIIQAYFIITSEIFNEPATDEITWGHHLVGELQGCRTELDQLVISINELASGMETGFALSCFSGTRGLDWDRAAQELTAGLAFFKKKVDTWLATIKEAQIKKQRAAEAKRELPEIESELRTLDNEWENLQRNLKEKIQELLPERLPDRIDTRFLENLVMGFAAQEAEYQRQLGREMENLARCLDKEVRLDEIEAGLDHAIEAEKNRVREEREHLARTVPAFPLLSVDKPIQRFLLYGGKAAEDFLLHTVELFKHSYAAGDAKQPPGWPQSYCYQRIWDVFCDWWSSEGRLICISPPPVKPRLVCWRKETMWYVGIQLAEGASWDNHLVINQEGRELDPFPGREECWALISLDGTVEARLTDGRSAVIEIGQLGQRGEPCFIFRGLDDRVSPLQLMKKPTARRFVAIVPDTWNCEEHHLNGCIYGPESVAISGYQTYLFDLGNEDKRITFTKPEGGSFHLELGWTRFVLEGRELSLTGDLDLGPLFIREPPRLRALYESAWDDTGIISLVRIGSNKDEYKELEIPREACDELVIQLIRTSGCYWVIVYDPNGEELERLPFRYAACLEEIRISPHPIPFCPTESGHEEVLIEFLSPGGMSVDPVGIQGISIQNNINGIVAKIPPDPHYIISDWQIVCTEGSPVPLRLVMERVYWCVADEGQDIEGLSWKDHCLKMERDWFRAVSEKVLVIKWAWQRGNIQVEALAGFEENGRRPYRAVSRGSLRCVKIPLRDFCDSPGLLRAAPFKIWFLDAKGKEFTGTAVGYLDVPDDPEQRSSCATCDFARRRLGRCWCGKKVWPGYISKVEFDQYRAPYVCEKWDGEVINKKVYDNERTHR